MDIEEEDLWFFGEFAKCIARGIPFLPFNAWSISGSVMASCTR
jgi:hypothetical protein